MLSWAKLSDLGCLSYDNGLYIQVFDGSTKVTHTKILANIGFTKNHLSEEIPFWFLENIREIRWVLEDMKVCIWYFR